MFAHRRASSTVARCFLSRARASVWSIVRCRFEICEMDLTTTTSTPSRTRRATHGTANSSLLGSPPPSNYVDLQNRLASYKLAVDKQASTIQREEARILALTEENAFLQEQLATVTAQASTSTKVDQEDRDRLHSSLNDNAHQLSVLISENDKLQQLCAALQSKCEARAAEVQQLESMVLARSNEAALLQSKLSERSVRCEEVETLAADLHTELTLEKQRAATLAAELSSAHARYAESSAQISAAVKSAATAANNAGEATSQLSLTRERLAASERLAEERQRDIDRLQQEMNNARQQYASDTTQLRDQIIELQRKLRLLELDRDTTAAIRGGVVVAPVSSRIGVAQPAASPITAASMGRGPIDHTADILDAAILLSPGRLSSAAAASSPSVPFSSHQIAAGSADGSRSPRKGALADSVSRPRSLSPHHADHTISSLMKGKTADAHPASSPAVINSPSLSPSRPGVQSQWEHNNVALTLQLSTSQASLAAAQQQHAQAVIELESLRQQLDAATLRSQQLQIENSQLKGESRAAREASSAAAAEAARQSAAVHACEARVESITQQLDSLVSAAASADDERQRAVSEADTLRREREDVMSQLQALNSRCVELEDGMRQATDKLTEARSHVASLRQHEHDATNAKVAAATAALQHELALVRTENASLRRDVLELRGVLAQSEADKRQQGAEDAAASAAVAQLLQAMSNVTQSAVAANNVNNVAPVPRSVGSAQLSPATSDAIQSRARGSLADDVSRLRQQLAAVKSSLHPGAPRSTTSSNAGATPSAASSSSAAAPSIAEIRGGGSSTTNGNGANSVTADVSFDLQLHDLTATRAPLPSFYAPVYRGPAAVSTSIGSNHHSLASFDHLNVSHLGAATRLTSNVQTMVDGLRRDLADAKRRLHIGPAVVNTR